MPRGCWTVVAIVEEDALKAAAFILDQEVPRSSSYYIRLSTVDTVEDRSGLGFFPYLNESTEAQVEASSGNLASELGC